MMRKRINYNEIINKLDEYLKDKNNKYLLIVVCQNENGYKISESDGKAPKEFYINTDEELEEYLKEKKNNTKCKIINVDVID